MRIKTFIIELTRQFGRSESGAFAVIFAAILPLLMAAGALATEIGSWAFRHQQMQGVADVAALSVATARASGPALSVQGRGVAASLGYVDGADATSVVLNSPPTSGAYKGAVGAVEAIISRRIQPVLVRLFSTSEMTVAARAVAVRYNGGACLLALSATASGAISLQGTAQVALKGCNAHSNSNSATALDAGGSSRLTLDSASAVGAIPAGGNITASGGLYSQAPALADPYAARSFEPFGGCTHTNFSASAAASISPGVYCGGIAVQAGAILSLAAGVYYLDGGSLKVAGNATLSGQGVSIVFTSSRGAYADAQIASNAIVDLSAPTSGPLAGIVLFGDRRMPTTTSFTLTGGGTQNWNGAIYLPSGQLKYAGGSTGGNGCTQIIADTVTFVGNSNLTLNCEGAGTAPLGAQLAKLVE